MSSVESVVTFNSPFHFSSLKEQDTARLSKATNTAKVTNTASRLIGRPVPDLQTHFEAKQPNVWRPSSATPCSHTLCEEL